MSAGYQETLQLADGATVVARLGPGRDYRLGLYWRGAPLVEFWSVDEAYHRRVGDRLFRYEFRSIEQLRYDFERDAQEALDRD